MGMYLPPDPNGPAKFNDNFKWITDAQEFALRSTAIPGEFGRVVNQSHLDAAHEYLKEQAQSNIPVMLLKYQNCYFQKLLDDDDKAKEMFKSFVNSGTLVQEILNQYNLSFPISRWTVYLGSSMLLSQNPATPAIAPNLMTISKLSALAGAGAAGVSEEFLLNSFCMNDIDEKLSTDRGEFLKATALRIAQPAARSAAQPALLQAMARADLACQRAAQERFRAMAAFL